MGVRKLVFGGADKEVIEVTLYGDGEPFLSIEDRGSSVAALLNRESIIALIEALQEALDEC